MMFAPHIVGFSGTRGPPDANVNRWIHLKQQNKQVLFADFDGQKPKLIRSMAENGCLLEPSS